MRQASASSEGMDATSRMNTAKKKPVVTELLDRGLTGDAAKGLTLEPARRSKGEDPYSARQGQTLRHSRHNAALQVAWYLGSG